VNHRLKEIEEIHGLGIFGKAWFCEQPLKTKFLQIVALLIA
jgi:hypothetical protein